MIVSLIWTHCMGNQGFWNVTCKSIDCLIPMVCSNSSRWYEPQGKLANLNYPCYEKVLYRIFVSYMMFNWFYTLYKLASLYNILTQLSSWPAGRRIQTTVACAAIIDQDRNLPEGSIVFCCTVHNNRDIHFSLKCVFCILSVYMCVGVWGIYMCFARQLWNSDIDFELI